MQNKSEKGPIVFFDGMCGLCSGAVRFILKWEKKPELYFMPMQSKNLGKWFPEYPYREQEADSIVLLRKGKYYTMSSAALRIAGYLKFPLCLIQYLVYLPRFLRDPIYAWIASNRFKCFKKLDTLYTPDKIDENRFLG